MKVSTYLKPRWVLGLKIFTDTFYGSYKDGTNGTRDFRQVAGIVFLIWMIYAILYAILVLTCNMVFTWILYCAPLTVVIAWIMVCVVFQPYKYRAANISGTILPICLIITAAIYSILDTNSQQKWHCFVLRWQHYHTVCSMAMEYTGWPSGSNSVPLLYMERKEFYVDF